LSVSVVHRGGWTHSSPPDLKDSAQLTRHISVWEPEARLDWLPHLKREVKTAKLEGSMRELEESHRKLAPVASYVAYHAFIDAGVQMLNCVYGQQFRDQTAPKHNWSAEKLEDLQQLLLSAKKHMHTI
jgi:hypothetical protein